MSTDVSTRVPPAESSPPLDSSKPPPPWVKSYRYLRTALVLLLVGLGAAVLWETYTSATVLSSVSAYYYTPAQPIFVAALIGLAACAIALRGTNAVEDVALNLAGMFAAVVAIVPTGRGVDYTKALDACTKAGPVPTTQGPTELDCPTLQALKAAASANIENSMVALLVVGAFGLIAAVTYTAIERRTRGGLTKLEVEKFWWGLGLSLLVYVLGLVAFLEIREWFIEWGHLLAAAGLLVCIVVAVAANAFRRRPRGSDAVPDEQRKQPGPARGRLAERVKIFAHAAARVLRLSLFRRDRYALIALVLLIVAVGGTALVLTHQISLFVLEIVVAALFICFWSVQTADLWRSESAANRPRN